MGRKEENIKKAFNIMNEPKKIRNIGIVAHIDHGKCVSPEARISLINGENPTARELFERYQQSGEIINESEQERVIKLDKLNLFVNSFDKRKGRIQRGRISCLWKLKKTDSLMEIEVDNGRSIRTTPEHKFLTLNIEGRIVEKRADKLQKEDFIVATRKLLHSGIKDGSLREVILKKLGEDQCFYARVNKELKQKLHEKILQIGTKKVYSKLDTKIKGKSFYHGVWRGQYRLNNLVKICDLVGIKSNEAYDSIEWINHRGTSPRGIHSSIEIRLPKNFEEFYYLAGLFFGDGDSWGNITNNHPYIQSEVKEIAEHLGTSCIVRRFRQRATRIEVGGITLKKMLEVLFEYPTKRKSNNLKISPFLERSPKPLIASFVRGYMDADGWVEGGRSAVSVSSASRKFLAHLQLLLYKFDIGSILNHKKNTLYISGRKSLENFKEIGFNLREKEEKFKVLLEKSSVSKIDRVPISGHVLEKIRKKAGIPPSVMLNGHCSEYEKNREGVSKNSLQKILRDLAPEMDPEAEGLRVLTSWDTSFLKVTSIRESDSEEFVYDFTVEKLHNFIAEGMVVHNTTLSDNLIAGAGMMSEELAGKQLILDYDEQERARGITIQSAAASMVHKFGEEEYLINLIDTPGHVDFSGDVTRAMRAVDGALVVVCAVEGVMPQTETVLRQAIKERVKPILFINKVDRLINELKLTSEEMQQRFVKIIAEVNKHIKKLAPKEFVKEWYVRVDDGSVAFGSAYYNWAISTPWMKKSKITFKDIYDYCSKKDQKTLAKRSPIHRILLDMVIEHLPGPLVAQKYRIPIVWRGDLDSKEGKAMRECDPSGELALMVTKILIDPHAGDVVFGRVYAGSVSAGDELWISGAPYKSRVQQVSLMVGPDRINIDGVKAGNVVALTGLSGAIAGSTVASSKTTEPFEKIVHYSDPVVTVAIEPKHATDLPKLINMLRSTGKADPSIEVTINQETGEYLVSGMGELHLEITTYRIREEHKIPISISSPIVVYRETVLGKSPHPFEGKSPNRHNSFYLEVEPLPKGVVKALREDEIPSNVKKYKKEAIKKLIELGMERDEAKKVFACQKTNLFVDATKGIQRLFETKELLRDAFGETMKKGPRTQEPLQGVKVRLVDAKLHEDAIHRGPAQVIPAVKYGIYGAITTAKSVLLEPIQKVNASAPQEVMGQITKEILQRRGTIVGMEQEGDQTTIDAKAPVAEMLGFSSAIRSATSGRVLWSTENVGFELLPSELQDKITREIRKRKGLRPEPYPAEYYEK